MYAVEPAKLIVLRADKPAQVFFEAQEAQRALSNFADVTWHIHAGDVPPAQVGLTIALETDLPDSEYDRQSYQLDVGDLGIRIVAVDLAGVLYGVMTLTQLLRQYGNTLPHLQIKDRPDFPRRGVMLDISRDKVPTMATLFDLVDLFAELKLNELQLYTEHTFAYRKHPVVWANASPMTGEEIMQLDAYCRARHIDLVPNQNSFGHMRRWLTKDEYRDLAEAPYGCDTRWGHFDEPFTLNPIDPRSTQLVESIFDDVLPHFSSNIVNVGCDETVDLGQGRSKEMVEEIGIGRTYLEFLTKIYGLTQKHGRTMQFWGDIIMEHPELVPHLPKNVIALEWGYEADHPFDTHGAKFAAAGVPFYVCPGTSTWNTLGGRTDNAIGSMLNAAENGLKHGAVGYLNTDWGDNGHLQPLPVSWLPYAYGAAVSWCVSKNRDIDIARAASLHLFGDPTGATGRFMVDLGNVYTKIPYRRHNSTPYGHAVFADESVLKAEGAKPDRKLTKAARARVDREIVRLDGLVAGLKINRPDAALIKRELRYVLALMQHGMRRLERTQSPSPVVPGKAAQSAHRKLLAEHNAVWLARNRIGGMSDSARNIKI
jgi:hypothetical protein